MLIKLQIFAETLSLQERTQRPLPSCANITLPARVQAVSLSADLWPHLREKLQMLPLTQVWTLTEKNKKGQGGITSLIH